MGECLRNCWDIFNKRPKMTLTLIVIVLIIVVTVFCMGGNKNESPVVPTTATRTTTTLRPKNETTDEAPDVQTSLEETRYRCYPLPNSSNHSDHISCYNMRLNGSHPYVRLITNIPTEQVTTIYLGGNNDRSGSQMHTLTADICNQFPNLEEIEGNNLDLQKIMDGAFNNCTKITEIRLANNSLTEFSTATWQRNKSLKVLYLEGNKLQNIDPKVVDKTFPSLNKITLKRNNITEQRYKEWVKAFEALKVTVIDKI